jgi:hypothetical protein
MSSTANATRRIPRVFAGACRSPLTIATRQLSFSGASYLRWCEQLRRQRGHQRAHRTPPPLARGFTNLDSYRLRMLIGGALRPVHLNEAEPVIPRFWLVLVFGWGLDRLPPWDRTHIRLDARPGNRDGLAALGADVDALAAQDLDGLPDAVRAERVLELRRLVDLDSLQGRPGPGTLGVRSAGPAPWTRRLATCPTTRWVADRHPTVSTPPTTTHRRLTGGNNARPPAGLASLVAGAPTSSRAPAPTHRASTCMGPTPTD